MSDLGYRSRQDSNREAYWRRVDACLPECELGCNLEFVTVRSFELDSAERFVTPMNTKARRGYIVISCSGEYLAIDKTIYRRGIKTGKIRPLEFERAPLSRPPKVDIVIVDPIELFCEQ